MFSYRPSLIGLGLVNVAFAFLQYERHGAVSTAMWLYVGMTLLYIANYFHFEHGMLFTWDVLEERFGLGLVWGDYAFVPFFYSLPGWYLVDRVEPLGAGTATAAIVLYVLGFWLFRGANEQKHRFKRDPRAPVWGAPPATRGRSAPSSAASCASAARARATSAARTRGTRSPRRTPCRRARCGRPSSRPCGNSGPSLRA